MAIIITGTPGTGKSTLAAQLSEETGATVVNITAILKQRKLDGEWDAKRNCFLVDVDKLMLILQDLAESDPEIIIDGHLSHYLPPEYVTESYVTKCDLPELKQRLEARGYDEEKVRENLDCEIFDVCHTEATEFGHDPEVVWTSNEKR